MRLVLISFLLGVVGINNIKNSIAQNYTFQQLLKLAENSSPLLNTSQKKVSLGTSAVDLASSYYFPIVGVSETFSSTNNPTAVFASKLGQQNFQMSDFQIEKLNKPAYHQNYQTSFYIQVPIDIMGRVSSQKKALEEQKESFEKEKVWTKKEITRSLYALYFTYHYMEELSSFYEVEKNFLNQIIKSYDGASSENKNRYLSYNQARIIYSNLLEGTSFLENEKKRILSQIEYLVGVNSIQLVFDDTNDISKKYAVSDFDTFPKGLSLRQDLDSMKKYVQSLEAEISKEKANYGPELGLFANHDISSEKLGKKKKSGENSSVGVQLTWNYGLSKTRSVELASAKKILAEAELKNKEMKVDQEINDLKLELKELDASIKESEARNKIYQENKKILLYQYKRGSVELYNLLENFVHYIQNYSELEKKKSEYQSKFIRYVDNYKEI